MRSNFEKFLILESSTFDVNMNHCEARSNYSIQNCLEYSLAADKCNVCKSPLILHNSGLTCSPKLDYCLEHLTSSSSLTCTSCASGFSYNSGTNLCEIKDQKCVNLASDGACKRCAAGYFLTENSTCSVASKFETVALNCSKSKLIEITAPNNSKINVVSCVECEAGYFKFFNANRCLKAVAGKTLNCLRYDLNNDCVMCKKGYYLTGAKACTIGALTGCVGYKTQTECETCEERFLLVSGKCHSLDDAEILPGIRSEDIKCLKWGIDKNTVTCDICLPNHAVKREQDTFITTQCIKDTTASPSISNCKVLGRAI